MEKVIVRQNQDFQVEIKVQDEGDDEPHQVQHIHELSPYTMMLASLGLCTGVVLHTYAHHHKVALEWATITTTYHREDCDDCEGKGEGKGKGKLYDEWIEESMELDGDLDDKACERLNHVGHQCSIHKMLESGIDIKTAT
jgi:uncharacterized OsmC-like protein